MSAPRDIDHRVRLRDIARGRRGSAVGWTFDIDLHNRTREARWWVVSDVLNQPVSALDPCVAAGVYVYEVGAAHTVSLYCAPSLEACLLGPGARVTLRGMTLRAYDRVRYRALHVWTGAELRAAGRPIVARWALEQPLTLHGAAQLDVAEREEVWDVINPDYDEDPITLDDRRAHEVPIEAEGFVFPPYIEA